MTELQNQFKKILADLEKRLRNKEDYEYVKEQFFKAYTMFLDEFDALQQSMTERIDTVTAKYSILEEKIAKVDEALDRIQKDIYVGEEYEAEIVCPYCDAEFTIDGADGEQDSVVCPECNNMIDLDWNEDHEGCDHDCHGCHHDCEENEDDM